MAEFGFVLKTFIISCIFVFCLQYKVDGVSAESKIFELLHSSRATAWLKMTGEGAVRLTASTINKVMDPEKAAQEEKVAKQNIVEQQMEAMKKHEEEWVKRVDQAVDGEMPPAPEY